MVAAHGGNLAAAAQFKAFGRIGVIAHNIAQAVNGIALKLFYILHHRFQSGQIGMDVTNQGYSTHGIVSKEYSTLRRFCQARLLTGNHGSGNRVPAFPSPLFPSVCFTRLLPQEYLGLLLACLLDISGNLPDGWSSGHGRSHPWETVLGRGCVPFPGYVQPVFQNKNITHQAGCPVAGILE